MTLTIVPQPAQKAPPRVGTWVKISVSLIVAGLLALTFATVIGIRWYYGLSRLQTTGSTIHASITMTVGHTQVIDELVGVKSSDTSLVDVRHISVRLGSNTANAIVDVEVCEPGGATPGSFALVGGATCRSPIPFRARAMNLSVERILVRVRPTRPGVVEVNGVTVSYKQGVRHATQHVGPSVTVTVKS